ncbi:MAG: 2-isopropylmalate synthase [Polyangiaceae bacterium]|nr:2-isopropylmalate synthase [Polyangiaceae bacterium]MCW5790212.1 2-isopropylmalate synthase [Polyangiaceae bacterium]
MAAPGHGESELIYDWNEIARKGRVIPKGIEFFDETLRDGLQNPSVKDPDIEDKLRLIHLMDGLGIHAADIGLPGSSKRAFDDCLRICQEVVQSKLSIKLACAGRTVASDITPMVELSQRAGVPIEVYAFVGSSPIRALAEEWDLERIKRFTAEAVDVGVKNGLSVCYVTEDTTRARPEVLAELFRVAVDHGAASLCLCDTVGHATPDGVRNLITFTRSLVSAMGCQVRIDWHGHNDRGLGLVNAIYALEVGADRVHGTALGIGERVGNAPMELILLNLKLLGLLEGQDLTNLLEYCQLTGKAVGFPIPINYPLVGDDAFRTATGVHAAAIIKAQQKGDDWLADRIYSGVPAGMFGRQQEICIGYMSGASNVNYWLRQRDIEPTEALVKGILARAKESKHILTEDEVLSVIHGQA